MKKSIKTLLAGLLIVPMLALGISLVAPIGQPIAAATDFNIRSGADAAKGSSGITCLFTNSSCSGGIFNTIVNILLYVIGAVSVIMLIYGGIRYTISGGVAADVTAAKNTILYAIVGIVVALLAYAIVNFVITSLVTT